MTIEFALPEAARDGVLDFINSGREDAFDELALSVFSFQYRQNQAYRSWCDSSGADPKHVRLPAEIPPVPTSAFKELEFVCAPPEAEFRTSGTTGIGNGRHLLPWLSVYRAASMTHFSHCVLEGRRQIRTFGLAPPPEIKPASSLSRMLEWIIKDFGLPGSGWFASETGLEHDRLAESLLDAQRGGHPVMLLGTSAAFLDFFHYCLTTKLTLQLPGGSLLMDTGGQKGTKLPFFPRLAEFQLHCYESAERFLGLPPNRCVNEYGMTELCSQFYDSTIVDRERGAPSQPRVKIGPRWVRTRILDPIDLKPVAVGEIGLLHHLDLANVGSAVSVLTEDLGREVPGGFVLEGRPRHAEPRGCGLDFAELSRTV